MGIISHTSLSVSKPAVFVDRDGTLNEDRGHISSPEDLRVFNFVGRALRRLNEAGCPTVIVTNQPVLARGEANYDDLRRIHSKLDAEMARFHAYFDRLYLCPHHPDNGFPGEVSELKIKCACRKPGPGLIYEARRDLNLDLPGSWFIGDTAADIGAAAAAGVTSILVQTGQENLPWKQTCHPDFIANDFAGAVDFILDIYPLLARSCGPILEQIDSGSHWFLGGASQSNRRSFAAALKRELRKGSKSCGLIHLDAKALTDSDLRACLQVHSKSVTLWEGSSALELAREFGLLHRSVYVEDSALLRDALPHSRCFVMNAWPSNPSLAEVSR